MPSVKIPRKSTATDMTPFVDIAFLILSFFIMATKFKPPEPVEITTPASVLAQELPDRNSVLITVDSANRVFFSVLSEKDPAKFDAVLDEINTTQNLNLTPANKATFRKTFAVGVPFSQLKSFLDVPVDDQVKVPMPGIPVSDSANNQLVYWIAAAKKAFTGETLAYLIKGDQNSKYPAFENVVSALKRNDEFKYNLVTALDDVPKNSEYDKYLKAKGESR